MKTSIKNASATKLKSFLSALALSAVASCGMAPAPAMALSCVVCSPTTVNTLVMHRKIQTGETAAERMHLTLIKPTKGEQ